MYNYIACINNNYTLTLEGVVAFEKYFKRLNSWKSVHASRNLFSTLTTLLVEKNFALRAFLCHGRKTPCRTVLSDVDATLLLLTWTHKMHLECRVENIKYYYFPWYQINASDKRFKSSHRDYDGHLTITRQIGVAWKCEYTKNGWLETESTFGTYRNCENNLTSIEVVITENVGIECRNC